MPLLTGRLLPSVSRSSWWVGLSRAQVTVLVFARDELREGLELRPELYVGEQA